MRRMMTACLIVMLGAACLGCIALAEGEYDLYLDQAPDGRILPDDSAVIDGLDLELNAGALQLAEPDPLDVPEMLMSETPQTGSTASNKTVFKKLIRYEIKKGEATVVYADRAICEAKIPEKIKGYAVTSIADGAFEGCKDLWTVTVPQTVTEIGENAFADCEKLAFVTLPVGLQKIGNYAFRNCPTIAHFELPEGLTCISEGLFENCVNMWKIAIPSTVQQIGDGAFYNCRKLKEFTLPDGLMEIGVSAFELCQDMRNISIPGCVEEIPKDAFRDCAELNIVKLNEGLRVIGPSAFRNCASMRSIKLPSSVEFIDSYAFAYCEEMTTLKIPDLIESLGYGAFFHCSDVDTVCVASGVKGIGDYCFAQCKSLEKVEIPDSVATIGEHVFTIGNAAIINEANQIQLGESLKQPKKMKLYGRPESAASAYAKAYGIPFVVKKILPTSLSIAEGKSVTLYVGQKLQLTAVQVPSNAETKVKWKSSSSAVSVSDTGLLTPKRSGKATITASTENKKKATISVKIIDANSVSILEGKTVTMKVGEELQLNAQVLPEQVITKLKWSSDSTRIATVNSTGLVRAKKKGTVTITVRTANKKKTKIKIKVTE